MRILVIQKRLSGHTWLPSIGRNSNSSRLCATMSEGPQHRRWEEHSLASLSMNCERHKWHLSFSLLPSQTTFSSSKHQNLSKTELYERERTQKNGYFHAMTVPLRSLNKNYTKDVLASSTSTILLHPFPENKYQNHVLDAIWEKEDR